MEILALGRSRDRSVTARGRKLENTVSRPWNMAEGTCASSFYLLLFFSEIESLAEDNEWREGKS